MRWVTAGLFLITLIFFLMWLVAMVFLYKEISWGLLAMVAFTVFWAYLAGAIIRGREIQSIGIDLAKMDNDEIDVTIALLEKQKRKNDKLNQPQKPDYKIPGRGKK